MWHQAFAKVFTNMFNLTTTPWSEHILSHSTNKKTKSERLCSISGFTWQVEGWGSTHPLTSRCCGCLQYTAVQNNFSAPPWVKSLSPEGMRGIQNRLTHFPSFAQSRVYKAQLCNTGDLKYYPSQTGQALKITPGCVVLQNVTCLNFLSSPCQEGERCSRISQSSSEEQAVQGNLFKKVY